MSHRGERHSENEGQTTEIETPGRHEILENIDYSGKKSTSQNCDDEEVQKMRSKVRKKADSKEDLEVSDTSVSDICRICHMGNFQSVTENRPTRQVVHRDASQMSTLSTYAHLGSLISACKCRGSVGLVHAECLERWLTESGHTSCELCGHRYATKRVPRHGLFRSAIIWFKTAIATRQMILDIVYLIVTTPLALFSCYICAVALKIALESGLREIPWMIVAMLPTCSLTLVAYWGWLLALGRFHGRRWRRFWRRNFVIRLLSNNSILPNGDEMLVESISSSFMHVQPNDFDDRDDISIVL